MGRLDVGRCADRQTLYVRWIASHVTNWTIILELTVALDYAHKRIWTIDGCHDGSIQRQREKLKAVSAYHVLYALVRLEFLLPYCGS